MLAGFLLTAVVFLLVWIKVQHLLFLRKWDHIPGYKSWSSYMIGGHAVTLKKPYQEVCSNKVTM